MMINNAEQAPPIVSEEIIRVVTFVTQNPLAYVALARDPEKFCKTMGLELKPQDVDIILKSRLMRSKQLEVLMLSITNICNLRCIHCSVNSHASSHSVVDTEKVLATIDSAAALGCKLVKLSGGEPLLHPNALQIMHHVVKSGMMLEVETNAVCLSEYHLESLAPILDSIGFAVSLDGSSPMNHDLFRGVEGAFANTFAALELLRTSRVRTKVMTVLNRLNVDEIVEMMEFTIEGFPGYGHHRLIVETVHLGRAKSGQIQPTTLAPREILQFLKDRYYPTLKRYRDKWGSESGSVSVPVVFLPEELDLLPQCGWGTNIIGVANGRIGLCYRTEDIDLLCTGHIETHNLEEVWQTSSLFKDLREISGRDLHGVCGNCIFANVCRGRCRAAAVERYGDLYAPSPFCQLFYEVGLFPKHGLIDPSRPCNYPTAPKTVN